MTRRHLANRRLAETFELTVAGLRYTCAVGRFPEARSPSCFSTTIKATALRTPTPATRQSCSRLRCNVVPIQKQSGERCLVTREAVPQVPLAPRWISSPPRRGGEARDDQNLAHRHQR
jgi:hypothetical protein